MQLEKVVGTAPQWQRLQIRDTHSHEVIVDDLSGLSDGATLGDVVDAIDPEQRASLQIYVNDVDPSKYEPGLNSVCVPEALALFRVVSKAAAALLEQCWAVP